MLVPTDVEGRTRWKLSSETISNSEYFLTPSEGGLEDFNETLAVSFSGQIKFNRKHRLVFKPFVSSKLTSSDNGEQLFFDAPEFNYQYRSYPLRVRLGLNKYRFGVMDGYSPLNTFNASQFFDPLQPRKLGVPSIDVQFESGDARIDLVYMPIQRKGIMPGADSRWLPRNVALNITGYSRIELPKVTNYSYTADVELDQALSNNWGLHIGYRLGSVDLHGVYFNGASTTPSVSPTLIVTPIGLNNIVDSDITLETTYYRQEVSGVGMSWALEKWILRLESAYINTLTENVNAGGWSWQSVLAVETNFNVGSKTLTALFQGFYATHAGEINNQATSGYRIFDESYVLGGRLTLSDSTSITVKSLHNTRSQGRYWGVDWSSSLTQNIFYTVAVDVFNGPDESLLGTYRENDRGYLKLTYYH